MKVSEITCKEIAEYLRLAEVTDEDKAFLTTLIGVAKDYILNYTGIIDNETLDKYEDMVIVVYGLVQDMFDNRAMYVDNSNLNRVVETIRGMHQVNLL